MSSPAPESARVLLALGGNQGAVLRAFVAALQALGAAGAQLVATSCAYRTRALVPPRAPPGPDYWNAACALRTALPPDALLALCQRLERDAGRRPGAPRWAPRPLDLDIIAHGSTVRRRGALRLPHPHVAARTFVLRPLAELPAWRLPLHDRSAAQLLAALPDPDAGILARCGDWWPAAGRAA